MEQTKRPNHRPPKERTIKTALDKEFYSVAEVAELLQLHENTIRKALRNGDLAGRQYGRTWRISAEALAEYTAPTNRKEG